MPAADGPARDAAEIEGDLSRLFAEVSPAVVAVISLRISRTPEGLGGDRPTSVSCRRLIASGIVVAERGCVVTTARAAQPGDSVTVHFPGGQQVAAAYVGMDPALHIAVLRLAGPGPYPALPVQPAEEALPEWVAAVAYGSWTGRRPAEPSLTLSQRASIEMVETNFHGAPAKLWRIQAPFFPGNGGGALVTLDGRWLGLITGAVAGEAAAEVAAGSVAPSGVGVIVPADVVVQAVTEIESGRRISQGFLGLRAVRRPATEGAQPEAPGVVVAEVLSGSPADCAGIRPGDVISLFDGIAVQGVVELTQIVRSHQPGDRIAVSLSRGRRTGRAEVVLGDRHAAGLYLTRRRQDLNERRALEIELRALDERRLLMQERLNMLREALRDTALAAPAPQSSAAY